MKLKNLTNPSAWSWRTRLANIAGYTFKGQRDFYKTLGYQRELDVVWYRARFTRNEVANRIVKALPNATWRGGAELWEDDDPNKETPFEEAFRLFDERLHFWDVLHRADVLAGIGRYAIILIGAPGDLDTPLENAKPEEILYLQPYGEDDAVIQLFETDVTNSRFGLPLFYTVKRTSMNSTGALNQATVGKRVHWTRAFHVVDGLLDDRIYGEPRLQCIWNRLDDLEKVAGGGAEAFWRRADQGIQFNVDETQDVDPDSKLDFEGQINEFEHGLKRYLLTRGVTATPLGSDVADFQSPVTALISLICAGVGIPQRVLMGSEQGKLAAKQDRGNWDDRVSDRRESWAGPMVVRPFVDYFTKLGALPETSEPYLVKFPELKVLDDEQKSTMASAWADINQKMGVTVVKPNEIRENVLGLEPLDDSEFTPINPQPAGPGFKAAIDANHTLVHRAADKYQPKVKDAVAKAFAKGRKALNRRELLAALTARDEQKVLELVSGAISITEKAMGPAIKLMADARALAGEGAAASLNRETAHRHLASLVDAAVEELRAAWTDREGFDDHGRAVKDNEKVARAKASYVPQTKEKTAKAAAQEHLIAKAIGGQHIGGQSAFDIHHEDRNGRIEHATEVKSVFGTRDKITMHGSSLERKEKLAEKHGATKHTIAVDMRGKSPTYYYARGFGSFRLGSMQRTSLKGLKKLIHSKGGY